MHGSQCTRTHTHTRKQTQSYHLTESPLLVYMYTLSIYMRIQLTKPTHTHTRPNPPPPIRRQYSARDVELMHGRKTVRVRHATSEALARARAQVQSGGSMLLLGDDACARARDAPRKPPLAARGPQFTASNDQPTPYHHRHHPPTNIVCLLRAGFVCAMRHIQKKIPHTHTHALPHTHTHASLQNASDACVCVYYKYGAASTRTKSTVASWFGGWGLSELWGVYASVRVCVRVCVAGTAYTRAHTIYTYAHSTLRKSS